MPNSFGKFFALPFINQLNFVLTFLPSLLFLFLNSFRKKPMYISRIVTEAIGHFAFETDLKLAKVKHFGGSKLLVINYGYFANLALKKKFEDTRKVIFLPKAFHTALNFFLNRIHSFRTQIPFEEISPYDPLNYESAIPQISLSQEEIALCKSTIAQFAPHLLSKPLVLLCIRDSQFDEEMKRDPAQSLSYRNSSPENFLEIATHYKSLGYEVIRMGRKTKGRLPENLASIIFDYSNSQLCSDLMDLYLFSTCDFVISSEFGIDELASIFRKPVFIVNYLPIHSVRISKYRSVVLPKVLIDANTKKALSIEEISDRNIYNIWSSQKYQELGVEFMENSPEIIADFVREAIEIMNSKSFQSYYSTCEKDKLASIMPTWWATFGIPIVSKKWINFQV